MTFKVWPLAWLYLWSVMGGCVRIQRKHVPLPGLLREIAAEPYLLNYNDCSNKAAKYFYAVKAAGYDPTIVVYELTGGKVHAVVRVGETYIDCTNARSTMLPPRGIMYENKEEDFPRFRDEYEVR